MADATYYAQISLEQTQALFKSSNKHSIPLLKERQQNLREAGQILKEKFKGKFINVLEKSDWDAVKLVKLVFENFPSFYDVTTFNNQPVYFFKRAQIIAEDITYFKKQDQRANLKNLNQLTAFANYKIPQILRAFDVIQYHPDLATKIDNEQTIKKDSPEEIEIRAATIWGVELLRQALKGKYSAIEIDNTLWVMSQDSASLPPYHRTRTIFY